MHLLKVEAIGVLDAAAKALELWRSADWYREEEAIEVCSDGKLWRVRPGQVQRWLHGGRNRQIHHSPEQSRLLFG